MPANTKPVFPKTVAGGVYGVLLTTAMTNTKSFDGTEAAGTALALVAQAGANQSRVDRLTLRYASTAGATASGTTTATLARIWYNNNSVNTTASNNKLVREVAIPAQAVAALGASELPYFELLDLPPLPPNHRIYVGLTVAVGGTNCAIAASAELGDY